MSVCEGQGPRLELLSAGETLISGVTGDEFAADIYIGPVYYQRLRHMVSDKFQVRSLGLLGYMPLHCSFKS